MFHEFNIHNTTLTFQYDCYGSGYSTSSESSSLGYGWTNAIILEFLDRWGDQMFIAEDSDNSILITKNSIFVKDEEKIIKKDDSRAAAN